MEIINVRFADLRRAAEQVPAYVVEKLSWDDDYNLQTGIEDMGCAGLDTEELLLDFSKQFSVDLSRFDFTGLISPEPSANPLLLLLGLFYLGIYIVAWTTRFLIGVAYWPFNPKAAVRLIKEPIRNPFDPTPQSQPPRQDFLTISDFVASAATGRFIKRERVHFVLV